MTRLQEVEKLLDNNLQLITDYTKRAAELIGSVRQLEKERDKLTKKNRGLEVVRCKDCVKLNRHDCPMCYIEKQSLRGASKLTKEYNRTIDDIVEGKGLKPLNSKEG